MPAARLWRLSDAVIDCLAARRMLLMLDNSTWSPTKALHILLHRLERARTTLTVVLTRHLLAPRGLSLSMPAAQTVWQRASNGNLLALVLFAAGPDDHRTAGADGAPARLG